MLVIDRQYRAALLSEINSVYNLNLVAFYHTWKLSLNGDFTVHYTQYTQYTHLLFSIHSHNCDSKQLHDGDRCDT